MTKIILPSLIEAQLAILDRIEKYSLDMEPEVRNKISLVLANLR